MSWYTNSMTANGGALKALLDSILPNNSKWHIEDPAAGANIGVYHNYDPAANVDYVLVVKDNQANYAEIELWQGWNSEAHVGTGQCLTTGSGGAYLLRIFKSAGPYAVSLRDHRFIFLNLTVFFSSYIGQLARFDQSKNMPVFIGHNAYCTSASKNPLGSRNYDTNIASAVAWRCLFDESGNINTLNPFGDPASSTVSSSVSSDDIYIKTSDSKFWMFECPVYTPSAKLLMGALLGVCYLAAVSNGLISGETIALNGIDWLVVGGAGYYSLIEKA